MNTTKPQGDLKGGTLKALAKRRRLARIAEASENG